MLEFSADRGETVDVIRLRGELDNYTARDFFDCIEGEINRERFRIVVDCSKLSFISSVGLATLLRIHTRMTKRGGNVKLAAVPSAIAMTLQIVRLDRIFALYQSVEEATSAMEREAGREATNPA
jgi:anti-anti-sigma factor